MTEWREPVTMSAYDLLPDEDRKAIAWVREQGGLERVRDLLNWIIGHCSTRQQLDFDFWLSGRVMYELGFEEDMADRDEVERRLLARLMPAGMEYNEEWSGDELYPTECYNCSECHHMTSDGMPTFCPNCGARVVEEVSDDADR